jgi:hypothetical protein
VRDLNQQPRCKQLLFYAFLKKVGAELELNCDIKTDNAEQEWKVNKPEGIQNK